MNVSTFLRLCFLLRYFVSLCLSLSRLPPIIFLTVFHSLSFIDPPIAPPNLFMVSYLSLIRPPYPGGVVVLNGGVGLFEGGW